MTGEASEVNFKGDEWFYDSPGTKGIDYQIRYMYADYFGDYNDYETSLSANAPRIQEARYADANRDRLSALDPNEPGVKTSTRWTPGAFEVVTNSDFDNPGGRKFTPVNSARIRDVAGTGCIKNCEGFYPNTSSISESGPSDIRRYLYNIRIQNSTQYGQLGIGEYIPIARQNPLDGAGFFRTTYTGVFGGDTFISKYAFNSGNLLVYWPYKREGDHAVNRPNKSNSHTERGYANTDGIEKGGSTSGGPGKAHGWDFRSCTYFFVESNINTNYRHTPDDETRQDYYPNQLNKSVLLNDYFPYLGNVRAYNTQYSYENNVRTFFIKGSTQNVVTDFENRTIYSEQAAADDTLDAYRSFPQNNFYDLPAYPPSAVSISVEGRAKRLPVPSTASEILPPWSVAAGSANVRHRDLGVCMNRVLYSINVSQMGPVFAGRS